MIGGSVYVYAKEDKETKDLNEILHERKGRRHEKLDDDKTPKQSRDEDMCVPVEVSLRCILIPVL